MTIPSTKATGRVSKSRFINGRYVSPSCSAMTPPTPIKTAGVPRTPRHVKDAERR